MIIVTIQEILEIIRKCALFILHGHHQLLLEASQVLLDRLLVLEYLMDELEKLRAFGFIATFSIVPQLDHEAVVKLITVLG